MARFVSCRQCILRHVDYLIVPMPLMAVTAACLAPIVKRPPGLMRWAKALIMTAAAADWTSDIRLGKEVTVMGDGAIMMITPPRFIAAAALAPWGRAARAARADCPWIFCWGGRGGLPQCSDADWSAVQRAGTAHGLLNRDGGVRLP